MNTNLKRAALVAASIALATAACAQSQDSTQPPLYPADGEQVADYCSEAMRVFLRELARTDGDVSPEPQSEEECRKQFVAQPGKS